MDTGLGQAPRRSADPGLSRPASRRSAESGPSRPAAGPRRAELAPGGPGASLPPGLRAQIQSEPWAHALGVEYLDLRPGSCRVALTLKPDMVNHQGSPHGGVLFTLADIAFGAACNSLGEPAVALSMTISFLSAAQPGSRLVAEATVRRQGRRAGFYEVTVSTDDGAPVAVVHCVAHRLPGRPRR